MSLKQTVKTIRETLAGNPFTGRLDAIRIVRATTGLTFKSARAMVDEVAAGASWYRGRGL